MTLVVQVLLVLMLQLPGQQEPSYRETPMQDWEQCVESVAAAMSQAHNRRSQEGTVYLAGCKLTIVEERGA